MLNTRNSVERLIVAFAAGDSRAETTVSRLASGSGQTLYRLRHGRDITTRRAERIIQWLSDHWPEGAEWPADIPRPTPNAADEAA